MNQRWLVIWTNHKVVWHRATAQQEATGINTSYKQSKQSQHNTDTQLIKEGLLRGAQKQNIHKQSVITDDANLFVRSKSQQIKVNGDLRTEIIVGNVSFSVGWWIRHFHTQCLGLLNELDLGVFILKGHIFCL